MRQVAIAAVLVLVACGKSSQMSAGMWTTEVALSAGQNQLWSSKVERCIDPKSGGDPVMGILSATRLGPCTEVETSSVGGNVSLLAQCMGRSDPMTGGMQPTRVRVTGSQTATAIDASIEAELAMEPESPKLTGKLSAHRTGDC